MNRGGRTNCTTSPNSWAITAACGMCACSRGGRAGSIAAAREAGCGFPHAAVKRGWGTSVRIPRLVQVGPQGDLVIAGAREHNLRDLHLRMPRNALVVITGLSGSGKSSLAFDTIYAEGQRRHVESLSAYARQFLGQMDTPDVDSLEGRAPAT